MKLTKTAIAVAILGIAAAPLAHADVKLSGYIGIQLGDDDSDGSELTLGTDDSTINVSASHTMNNGLTGYGNVRLDGGLTGDGVATDNAFVGIRGSFGDFRVGEVTDATEYGQVAGDILADVGGENQGIGYEGVFGPVSFGANYSPEGNNDHWGVGAKFALAGFAVGLGAGADGNQGGDTTTNYSVGLSFAAVGASIAIAYKEIETLNDTDGSDTLQTAGAKIGFSVADFGVAVTYEQIVSGVGQDDNVARIDLDYGMGGGMALNFRAQANDIGEDDTVSYRLLLSKSY